MELALIEEAIRGIEGVNEVHDLHVWSIGSDTHSLSCHVGIADVRASESEDILRRIREQLAGRFHIHHTTIQFELAVCEVAEGCVIPVSQRQRGHSH